jgi:hypothetical protein
MVISFGAAQAFYGKKWGIMCAINHLPGMILMLCSRIKMAAIIL